LYARPFRVIKRTGAALSGFRISIRHAEKITKRMMANVAECLRFGSSADAKRGTYRTSSGGVFYIDRDKSAASKCGLRKAARVPTRVILGWCATAAKLSLSKSYFNLGGWVPAMESDPG
jgi:hypothetical protein